MRSRPGKWRRGSPRAQRFTWTEDGFPDFGKPVGAGIALAAPAEAKAGAAAAK